MTYDFIYVGVTAFLMFIGIAYKSAKDENIDALEFIAVLAWPIVIPFGLMYLVGFAFFESAKWFGRKWL
jgi:hypothetical protein